MNGAELYNDHTLHILLDDLVKARKSPDLGPIRLQAFLDYAEKKSVEPGRREMLSPVMAQADDSVIRQRRLAIEVPRSYAETVNLPAQAALPEDQAALIQAVPEAPKKKRGRPKGAPKPPKTPKPKAGFAIAEDNAKPEDLRHYLADRMAERKDPQATLKEAADIVEAALKQGNWSAEGTMSIPIPRGLVVSGLGAILKHRKVNFTDLVVSMPPANTHIPVKSYAGLNPDSDEKKMHGAAGERTAGWIVLVTK